MIWKDPLPDAQADPAQTQRHLPLGLTDSGPDAEESGWNDPCNQPVSREGLTTRHALGGDVSCFDGHAEWMKRWPSMMSPPKCPDGSGVHPQAQRQLPAPSATI